MYRLLDNPRFYLTGHHMKRAIRPYVCEIEQKSLYTNIDEKFISAEKVYELKRKAQAEYNVETSAQETML